MGGSILAKKVANFSSRKNGTKIERRRPINRREPASSTASWAKILPESLLSQRPRSGFAKRTKMMLNNISCGRKGAPIMSMTLLHGVRAGAKNTPGHEGTLGEGRRLTIPSGSTRSCCRFCLSSSLSQSSLVTGCVFCACARAVQEHHGHCCPMRRRPGLLLPRVGRPDVAWGVRVWWRGGWSGVGVGWRFCWARWVGRWTPTPPFSASNQDGGIRRLCLPNPPSRTQKEGSRGALPARPPSCPRPGKCL